MSIHWKAVIQYFTAVLFVILDNLSILNLALLGSSERVKRLKVLISTIALSRGYISLTVFIQDLLVVGFNYVGHVSWNSCSLF